MYCITKLRYRQYILGKHVRMSSSLTLRQFVLGFCITTDSLYLKPQKDLNFGSELGIRTLVPFTRPSPFQDAPLSLSGNSLCWRKRWDSNSRDALTSGGFQDRCHRPLGHASVINILMHTYDAITKTGLIIHLSMSTDNTGYILVYDLVEMKVSMKFFTDVNSALEFIHSL